MLSPISEDKIQRISIPKALGKSNILFRNNDKDKDDDDKEEGDLVKE
jgi:hypothetical protein